MLIVILVSWLMLAVDGNRSSAIPTFRDRYLISPFASDASIQRVHLGPALRTGLRSSHCQSLCGKTICLFLKRFPVLSLLISFVAAALLVGAVT